MAAATSYDPGGANLTGRGWYYKWSQAELACQELGPGWWSSAGENYAYRAPATPLLGFGTGGAYGNPNV
ncbi:hypothetical protein AGMMS49525_01310 [Bacteroidia bacterium]|nr:hypothetical protein AGMMS49525_01310 [Bacteroidia bacterium]